MPLGGLPENARGLYGGVRAISGAEEVGEGLRADDLANRRLTTSTRRENPVITEQLLGTGFSFAASEILTPAEAAHDWRAK